MEARKVLEKVAQFEKEMNYVKPAGHTENRNKLIDEMIANIGNPRTAEQLRIFKLVESQFDEIEKQVKEEVKTKMDKTKKEKKSAVKPAIKPNNLLSRAKSVRVRETERKMKISKQNESIIFPELKGRVVSFKEHVESQKHGTSKDFRFEVLKNDFIHLALDVLCNRNLTLRGLYGDIDNKKIQKNH